MLAPDAKPRWRSFLEDVVSDEVQRIVSGQTDHLARLEVLADDHAEPLGRARLGP